MSKDRHVFSSYRDNQLININSVMKERGLDIFDRKTLLYFFDDMIRIAFCNGVNAGYREGRNDEKNGEVGQSTAVRDWSYNVTPDYIEKLITPEVES